MNMKAIAVATFITMSGVSLNAVAADNTPTAKSERTQAGQYASDTATTTKVKSALLAERNLKSLDINVETQNGVVQLSGFAASSAQIDQAVDVAKNVKGVKDVKNDLRLKTDTEG